MIIDKMDDKGRRELRCRLAAALNLDLNGRRRLTMPISQSGERLAVASADALTADLSTVFHLVEDDSVDDVRISNSIIGIYMCLYPGPASRIDLYLS